MRVTGQLDIGTGTITINPDTDEIDLNGTVMSKATDGEIEFKDRLGNRRRVKTIATDSLTNDDDVTSKRFVDNQIAAVNAAKLSKDGGTLTGDLVLNGAPTQDNQASTKKYVDDVAVGKADVSFVNTQLADKADTTYVNAQISSAVSDKVDANFVNTAISNIDNSDLLAKTGGTMTGTLTLASDPLSNMEAATKQYVDNATPDLSGRLATTGGSMSGNITFGGAGTSALVNVDFTDAADASVFTVFESSEHPVTTTDGGYAFLKNNGSSASSYITLATEIGTEYTLTTEVTLWNGSSFRIWIEHYAQPMNSNNAIVSGYLGYGTQTYTNTFTATSTSAVVWYDLPGATDDIKVHSVVVQGDGVSCKRFNIEC